MNRESLWQKFYRFRSNLSNSQKDVISVVGALFLTGIIVFVWFQLSALDTSQIANVSGPIETIINQIKSLF